MKEIDGQKLEYLVSKHTNEELCENKIGCKEVIVHQNGKCVYHGVFGTNPVGEAPAAKGLIYRAASMTKPITAAAVLTLVDKGQLSLKDKVSKFFPKAENLKVAVIEDDKIVSLNTPKKELDISDLLSHTSGIGCDSVLNIVGVNNEKMSLDEAIDNILSKPLAFDPDSSQCYGATEAFDIAAGIVEKVSGCSYDEYLEENLFKPLGMVNTTFSPTKEQWGNLVSMHNLTKDGKSETVIRPEGCVFENCLTKRMPAGAGLVTTADDYIKFADMLCMGGLTADNKRFLSENTVKLMSTPHESANIENWCEKWGLGVRIVINNDYMNGLEPGCFGWSGAYGTHFWVDPNNRITAVMMKNSCFDGGAGNKSACQLEKDVSESLKH